MPMVIDVPTDYRTCIVFLLGYPGVGKRTVGTQLCRLLDGVLVDNQLINGPLLTLFKWDGKFRIPIEIWERVVPTSSRTTSEALPTTPKCGLLHIVAGLCSFR